jgi:hypothetical protein
MARSSGEGVLEFVANSAQERAAHYREQAAQLRTMAEAESIGHLRNGLLSLADQFDGFAATINVKPLG